MRQEGSSYILRYILIKKVTGVVARTIIERIRRANSNFTLNGRLDTVEIDHTRAGFLTVIIFLDTFLLHFLLSQDLLMTHREGSCVTRTGRCAAQKR